MLPSDSMVASVAMSALNCCRFPMHKVQANEKKKTCDLQEFLHVIVYHTLHFFFGFISVVLAHMKAWEKIALFCKA